MNAHELMDRVADLSIENDVAAKQMSVYTLNDNGNLVEVTQAKVIFMRDGGESVPVLVLKR